MVYRMVFARSESYWRQFRGIQDAVPSTSTYPYNPFALEITSLCTLSGPLSQYRTYFSSIFSTDPEEPAPAKTFTGQKTLTTGSAIQLLLPTANKMCFQRGATYISQRTF